MTNRDTAIYTYLHGWNLLRRKNRKIPLAIYYALFSLLKVYFTLYFWKNHLFLRSFHTEKSPSDMRAGID